MKDKPIEDDERIRASASQIAEAAIKCCYLATDAEEMAKEVQALAEESFSQQKNNFEKISKPALVVGYALAIGELRWRIENYVRAKYGNITLN